MMWGEFYRQNRNRIQTVPGRVVHCPVQHSCDPQVHGTRNGRGIQTLVRNSVKVVFFIGDLFDCSDGNLNFLDGVEESKAEPYRAVRE